MPLLPLWEARLSLLPSTPALPAVLLRKLVGAMDARLEGKHALACSRGDARSRVAAWSGWCCCSRCMKSRMGECRVTLKLPPAATLSKALEGADTELRARTPGGEGSEPEEREEEEEEWEESGGSGTTGAEAAGADPEDAGGARSSASSSSMS